MTAEIIHPIFVQRIICTGCGAEANAPCNCGLPYEPKAERARKAIEANPEKSDRAIAAELGVDHKTVGAARRQTGEHSPVDTRIGLDGKTRRMPQRTPYENSVDAEDGVDPDEKSDEISAVIYAGTAIDLAVKLQEIILRPDALTRKSRDYIRRAVDEWLKIGKSI